MILVSFVAFLALASLIAVIDWRRGWYFVPVIGVLQDPVRKLTPGSSVAISMSVVVVFAAVIVGHQAKLRMYAADFARRFRDVWGGVEAFGISLAIAFLTGITTFGVAEWKVPTLGLFMYLAPIPAILLGYMFVDREERIVRFFGFYAAFTSLVLVGSLLEYLRVDSKALGMVAQQGDYIRHLPGIQIRMIAGLYRGPDIMAWHAATLTAIGIASMLRVGISKRSWIWMVAAGWGFFNCMISGRRKAIYYVAVFLIIVVWRYFRRIQLRQFFSFLAAAVVLVYVFQNISADEQANVYARGARATQDEFRSRLEGGFLWTVQQSGFLGAGLGSATQGAYHLTKSSNLGWQEGGLGKLARELGIPGLAALALLAALSLRMMLRIAAYPDEPEGSQLMRVTVFALVIANGANFLASAQTYADPLVSLFTAFLIGTVFGTAAIADRVKAARPSVAATLRRVPAVANG